MKFIIQKFYQDLKEKNKKMKLYKYIYNKLNIY